MGAAYLFDINGNPLRRIDAPDTVNNDSFGQVVEIDSGKIIIGDPLYHLALMRSRCCICI